MKLPINKPQMNIKPHKIKNIQKLHPTKTHINKSKNNLIINLESNLIRDTRRDPKLIALEGLEAVIESRRLTAKAHKSEG